MEALQAQVVPLDKKRQRLHVRWLVSMMLCISVFLSGCDLSGIDANAPQAEGNMLVHYIDVDQGDAALLQGPDFTILIDTGRHDRDEVVPYLKENGVEHLDLVIGTHPHADHIGQLDKVMKEFPVDEVWMSGATHTSKTFERVIDAVMDSEAGYHEPKEGEQFLIGSAKIEVLHPEKVDDHLNNGSIVTRITYGEIVFLFTGDAEKEAEKEMLDRGQQLQADVLKLGHHGSSTSNTAPFLEAVDPLVAIYSAGSQNTYGHPHKEVVEQIEQMGIKLYGTDESGTVLIETDGETIELFTLDD